MFTLSFEATNGNLLLGFIPESLGLLLFGIGLIAFAVGLRKVFNRKETKEKFEAAGKSRSVKIFSRQREV